MFFTIKFRLNVKIILSNLVILFLLTSGSNASGSPYNFIDINLSLVEKPTADFWIEDVVGTTNNGIIVAVAKDGKSSPTHLVAIESNKIKNSERPDLNENFDTASVNSDGILAFTTRHSTNFLERYLYTVNLTSETRQKTSLPLAAGRLKAINKRGSILFEGAIFKENVFTLIPTGGLGGSAINDNDIVSFQTSSYSTVISNFQNLNNITSNTVVNGERGYFFNPMLITDQLSLSGVFTNGNIDELKNYQLDYIDFKASTPTTIEFGKGKFLFSSPKILASNKQGDFIGEYYGNDLTGTFPLFIYNSNSKKSYVLNCFRSLGVNILEKANHINDQGILSGSVSELNGQNFLKRGAIMVPNGNSPDQSDCSYFVVNLSKECKSQVSKGALKQDTSTDILLFQDDVNIIENINIDGCSIKARLLNSNGTPARRVPVLLRGGELGGATRLQRKNTNSKGYVTFQLNGKRKHHLLGLFAGNTKVSPGIAPAIVAARYRVPD
jgi:hypothetical protein